MASYLSPGPRPVAGSPRGARQPREAAPGSGSGGGGGEAEDAFPTTPTRGDGRAAAAMTGADRTQTLKDYKVTIEYKYLKQNAPGGVVIVPSHDDLRLWHGVIFIRKSLWANAIFKFLVHLPPAYNDHNVWPEVRFTSKVFNPFVDYETGELDLKVAFPVWDPNQHFMATVLTFVKKIFYIKDFSALKRCANREAHRLFHEDKAEFKRRVDRCVMESQETVYDDMHRSPIRFRQPAAAHDALRASVLDMGEDGSLTVKTKDDVLKACQQARPDSQGA